MIPIDDAKEHSFHVNCECEPTVWEEFGVLMVKHDAFDGRIAVEMANEILNQNNNKMKVFEKFKKWLKSAGLRSVVYLAGGVAAFILLNSTFLLGVGVGIFGADNWVTIKELIKK